MRNPTASGARCQITCDAPYSRDQVKPWGHPWPEDRSLGLGIPPRESHQLRPQARLQWPSSGVELAWGQSRSQAHPEPSVAMVVVAFVIGVCPALGLP